jgi:hypothetical protein
MLGIRRHRPLRGPIGLAMIAGGIAYLGATGGDMEPCGRADPEQPLRQLRADRGADVHLRGERHEWQLLSERIYALAHALMGRFRGGLAHVSVLASVIFAV